MGETNGVSGGWTITAAAASVLTAVCAGAVVVLVVVFARHARADRAALAVKLDRLEKTVSTEIKEQTRAEWRSLEEVRHNCSGYAYDFRCSFTNPGEAPIFTCVQAQLVTKEGATMSESHVERFGKQAGTLRSFVMCTGRIAPRSTVSLSVPWERGNAEDVCGKRSPYGGRNLNWSQCDFAFSEVVPTNMPTPPPHGTPNVAPATSSSAAAPEAR